MAGSTPGTAVPGGCLAGVLKRRSGNTLRYSSRIPVEKGQRKHPGRSGLHGRPEVQPMRDGISGKTEVTDRKSTRLNSSHVATSYAVFCLKKKSRTKPRTTSLSTKATPQPA